LGWEQVLKAGDKMDRGRNKRKVREGVVLSGKMDKTIIVRVSSLTRHQRYGRVIKQASKFKVHDEQNQAKAGDKVRIMETRPLSKEKRWRLVEVVK
jgi:small subunit ribosomal protein S17